MDIKEIITPIDWDFEKDELLKLKFKLMSMNKLLITEKQFIEAKYKAILNEFKATYPERQVINHKFDYVSLNNVYNIKGHILSK